MVGPDVLGWQPHPDVWLMLLVLVGGYLYALSAWGRTHAPGGRPASRRQIGLFLLGAFALWLASDWPVHGYDEVLFSVHMVQHLLYAFVAAPLLILGTPAWLFRRLLRPRVVGAVVSRLTRPLVALVVFNGWMLLYHTPLFVNWSVHSPAFHFATHVVWVLAGVVMWWPVLSPLPELPHISSYFVRMGYLFAQTIIPSIPASFFTFARTPFYETYAAATQLVGVDAVDDQQLAGLIMKLGAGAILWTVIGVLFYRWLQDEEHGEPDPLYWRDLEPEVTAVQRHEEGGDHGSGGDGR